MGFVASGLPVSVVGFSLTQTHASGMHCLSLPQESTLAAGWAMSTYQLGIPNTLL